MVAGGTPSQIKAAAGVERSVRFRATDVDPASLGDIPGVVAVDASDGHVTLHTTDADATVWGLYGLRHKVHDLEITGGGLQEAFLALTGSRAPATLISPIIPNGSLLRAP